MCFGQSIPWDDEKVLERYELLYEAGLIAEAARELGQYQLKRSLGAGGMGEVYLAEHRLLKRPCAVKLSCSQPRRTRPPGC